MSRYLQQLNDVQSQAVTTTEGPVLVVAGPGSGKTRVLTYRIAYLIEQGVAPWNILALTFTNKAAREMKARIARVVGDRAEQVWAGTFHSIFARILRTEADKIGYPAHFTIYDTEDTKSVLSAIVREMNLDKDTYNVNTLRARISSAKSNLVTPRRYEENDELREEDRRQNRPLTYAIYEKYVARCKRSGAMDFDDLLYRLYELLQKNPDNVLEKYRQRFQYVLVDEFQDTNHLQYAIVRKLVNYDHSPRNICVVGDDAQSIYAFRGATIQNILDFEQDFKPFGIKVFKLEQNYRSTEPIVQAANEVIQHNRRQIHKKIWSHKGEGQRIKVIKARTDTEEGIRVVDTLLEQKNRFHLRNSDIAILYRTNAQSRVFEEHLRKFNILYRVFGGQSFYQRKEVKDLIAYLRLAVNLGDDEALRRVINYPRRGIGEATIDKISALAGQTNRRMWDCLAEAEGGPRVRAAIADFVAMMTRFHERTAHQNAYELALDIARASGLVEELKKDTTLEGIGRKDNLDALLDGIKSFVEEATRQAEALNPTDVSLAAYLQNIALLTDLDEPTDDSDFVTLMSVHAAKGLEFKSIFVVGLEENLFPSYLSMESPEGMEEERRLFYVAITRAEQLLTLSYAENRYRYGQMRRNEPSRFLGELPRKYLESTAAMSWSRASDEDEQPRASGVQGTFPAKRRQTPVLQIDPKDFKPSPSDAIEKGMQVLHLKFGKGRVLSVEGHKDSRVATICFEDDDYPERRIMLKFAKLQIL